MTLTAHHLYLLAPGASPDDVRRFYRDGLGLAEVPTPPQASPTFPSSGSPPARSTSMSATPPEGIVGDGHTALATDDVDAARARCTALGYTVDDG